MAYQTALRRVMKGREEKRRSESDSISTLEADKVSVKVNDVEDEKCIDPQSCREQDVISSCEIPPLDSEKTVASIASAGEHEKSNPEVVSKEVHLSFRDVNPLPPLLAVLSRWNNIVILIASGTATSHIYHLPDDFCRPVDPSGLRSFRLWLRILNRVYLRSYTFRQVWIQRVADWSRSHSFRSRRVIFRTLILFSISRISYAELTFYVSRKRPR